MRTTRENRSKKHILSIEDFKIFLSENGFKMVRYKGVNLKKREYYINEKCDIIHIKLSDKENVIFTMYEYDPKYAKNQNGYHMVVVGSSVLLHRVVAWTFLGEPEPDQTDVDHIDGNKDNNHPSNLRWCTRSENMKYYYERKKAI